MSNALLPKTALAAVAAVGLLLPFGAPLPGSCLRTIGIAGAAPSPTCASDLRDCLRGNAKTGLYGVRYVTADDVARCMEAFRSCVSGGASRGGNAGPPKSTGSGGESSKGLPARFGISFEGMLASDCRVTGAEVTCTDTRLDELAEGQDSWVGGLVGTVSGMSVTGTKTIRIEGHYSGVPGCFYTEVATGPATYSFDPSGTVRMREGPLRWQKTIQGNCESRTENQTSPAGEGTATWSAKN